MDTSFLKNLHRAAQAGMADYASPDDWHRAIVAIAKANRQMGETEEQAYARLTAEEPTVRQLDKMRRQALAQADVAKAKGGRPRKYHPAQVSITKAEDELSRRALARAKVESTSFERAFVREIDTAKGRELYQATRGQA